MYRLETLDKPAGPDNIAGELTLGSANPRRHWDTLVNEEVLKGLDIYSH